MARQAQASKNLIKGAVPFFALAILWGFAPFCRAESVASKNNRGNRLFNQGKFEDAEKAYLSAQGDDPGRPEVLYNLGNSLIKQKKYREALQALGQAISKGDKRTKENGWYNTGNALYSAGSYKESADAFIQALKVNPADGDAKHNLELALMKLKQQEQNSKNSGRSQSGKDEKKNASAQQADQKKTRPSGQSGQTQPTDSQRNESARNNESITKDQAMRLLDAMQSREIEEQRKMSERRARSRADGRDW